MLSRFYELYAVILTGHACYCPLRPCRLMLYDWAIMAAFSPIINLYH